MKSPRQIHTIRQNIASRLQGQGGASDVAATSDESDVGEGTDISQLLEPYRSLIVARPSRVVALLVGDGARDDEAASFLEFFQGDQLYVVSSEAPPEWGMNAARATHVAAESLWQVNWQLKKIGQLDIIICLGGPQQNLVDWWDKLFLHLRHRGTFLLRPPPGKRASSWSALISRLSELAQANATFDLDKVNAQDREMAMAVGRLTFGRDLIAVTKRGHHFLKLRDLEADRFLPTRSGVDTVRQLASLPKGELSPTLTLKSYGNTSPLTGFPNALAYPEMHLRHYEGQISMATHSLLYCEGSILPESFRYHLEKTLKNVRLVDSSPDFARVPEEFRPVDSLPGTYFHLDSPFTGHFGHIMTEVVSRLWGWDQAKAEFPDLKALFRIRYPNDRYPELETQLFQAYGIAKEDIVWVDHPVTLESVVGVTPMWHNQDPHYVHPEMHRIWQRIGSSLADPPPLSMSRIFVSRTPGLSNRRCRNTGEVESLFERHGFSIVYPENLSLREQAGVFAQANVVAGFGGSAMFNVMFGNDISNLILLTHEAYTARNEFLFSSVLGCDVDYFWSQPDIPHPKGGWSQEAFTSDWEFDLVRLGDDLEDVLRSLPS